ncbi:uncharacterized protein LOC134815562 [Bolinopsis microptera]|uniref:uncharacterized protein LOC134815562 n=1 Tax=Bolinopsis microptera TaxID=2820187 RepID=UPI00307A0C3A
MAVKMSTSKPLNRFNSGTCTHGNSEGVQWWEVDLQEVYNIEYIEVYGRTDCCSDRLEGAKLWIGNNKCATLKNMGAAQKETVRCEDPVVSVGRKVRIEVLNYLTLCEVKVFTKTEMEIAVSSTKTPPEHKGETQGDFINVAIHKPVHQSSTGHNGFASRAVDGYTTGIWGHRSCSYTRNNGMNYWEVDLGRVYNIDHIMVYGRSDAEPNWLNGASVKVGEVTCQLLAGMEEGNKNRVDCGGDKEKLVVKKEGLPEPDVVIPTVNYAQIGEVIDDFFNVAKGKNATASSEPWGGKAARAVDGVVDQHWGRGSCTHTNRLGNEWWEVDLGRVYQIDHVRVWGRTDAHTERLDGARLWIGDHRCGKLKTMANKAEADIIKCEPAESVGRKVRIEHFSQYITLCEVQVMVKQSQIELQPNTVSSDGEREGEYTNVALRKEAWQSSTAHNGWASRAVDGWVKTHWNQGSCTHTNQHGVHTWSVNLGKAYKVDHVKFWGRTDAAQDRIKWVNVFVGRTKIGYLDEEGYGAGMPYVLQATNSEREVYGKIVRFERLANYLTLCEVQVMVKNEDLLEEEMPTTFPEYENVARNKPTNQSSTAHGGESKRAVDGYMAEGAVSWNGQSCTHTNRAALEYWEVDLEHEYHIDHIKILGRSDCCRERMGGAVIKMDGKTVAGLSYYTNQLEWTVPMNYAKGRRLTVTQTSQILTICEFAVYVDHNYDPTTDTENQLDLTEENLALKKVATSSSVMLGGEAGNGVDGDSEGNYYKGSCVSTGVQQGESWWMVDLVDSHSVGHVIVYPRLDTNLAANLDGAVVSVGEHVCGSITFVENRQWYRLDCKGQAGSNVSVKKETGHLQFCEVIVQAAED